MAVAFEESRTAAPSNPLQGVAEVSAPHEVPALAPALRYSLGESIPAAAGAERTVRMKIPTALALTFVIAVAPLASVEAQSQPTASPTVPGPVASPGPGAAPAAIPPPAAVSPPAASIPVDYIIGPGDVLSVSVWKNEALSRVVPVRPDGKISLPLLQDIHAAGLTAMQLRDKISAALVEFLPSPEVAVTLTEVNSFRVSVLGEVMKPGVYQFRSAATVLEAIALAGGLGRYATANKIAIIRRDSNGATRKFSFNYNRAVTTTSDQENFLLQPGDVIVVP